MPDQNQPTDPSLNPVPGGTRPVLTTEEVPTSNPPAPTDTPAPTLPTNTPPPTVPEIEDVTLPPLGSTAPTDTVIPPTQANAPSFDMPAALGAPPKKKFGGRRVISTILGLLLLVGGVGAGVVLVRQQQDIRERAKETVCTPAIDKENCTTEDGCAGTRVCNSSGQWANCVKKDSSCGKSTSKDSSTNVKTGASNECAPASSGNCIGKNVGASCGTSGTCKKTDALDAVDRPICKCEIPATSTTTTTGGTTTGGQTSTGGTTSTTGGIGEQCLKGGTGPDTRDATYEGKCKIALCPNGDTDKDGTCSVNKDTGFKYGGSVDCSEGLTALGGQCGQVDPIGTDGIYCKTASNKGQYGIKLTDCGGNTSRGGTTTTTTTTAQCLNVKVYDTQFNLLTVDQLKALEAGDVIRLAVAGTTTSGSFDKARFKINSGSFLPETITKKPASQEFYSEYTIPEGITSFNITAQIHHSTLGWSN